MDLLVEDEKEPLLCPACRSREGARGRLQRRVLITRQELRISRYDPTSTGFIRAAGLSAKPDATLR
jgi:hypothetical protein